jgi:photosystem II stability/assembly factor-like uncharacterized protein
MTILLIAGTNKGAFIYRSDATRAAWTISDPIFKGWKVTALGRTPSGRYLAATASDVYGAAVQVSDDLHAWRQVGAGPSWNGAADRALKQVWTFATGPDRVYAGVEDAGIFTSDDDGETWNGVPGFNEMPGRDSWMPGAGGLCAHAILLHEKKPQRVFCGVSAAGVWRSDDGGRTWKSRNDGVPPVIEDRNHKDIGRCNHGLAIDPNDPDVIYRREHNGMFRSRDGGETWERIERGLGSWFGFPLVIDPRSRALFAIPLESDEYRMPSDGRLQVLRSLNQGDSWQSVSKGLPERNCYTGVLRGAMAVDSLDPCGVYFGTSSGTVYASNNAGDSWTQLPGLLPRIMSMAAFVEA